jgi:hypothetical protein
MTIYGDPYQMDSPQAKKGFFYELLTPYNVTVEWLTKHHRQTDPVLIDIIM